MRKLLYNACIVCASCLLLFPCRVSANESTAIFEEVTDGTSNLDLELSSQTLTDTSSSNEVTIEGNLPEGAKVSVTELNTEDYLSILAEYYNTSVENVFCVSALDITIETVDGEEFQPKDYNETVMITIQDVETTENDKEVIHIEDTALDSVSAMLADNTYTEFETDSFSVYLIGGVSYDTSNAEFLNNDYASAYLFSDGRLLVTAFKKNGSAATSYPWYAKKASIKTVSFADSITFIGKSAFYKYSNLTGELIIPNSVTSIEESAFYTCSGFTGDLIIPDGVITIGPFAFQYCSGFTGDLIISDSVTTLDKYTFYGCKGFKGNLKLSNNLTTIPAYVFQDCSGFTGGLTIPDSVTIIGPSAFQNCSGFNSDLTISNSVTAIGSDAFYGCSGFTGDLILPNSITTLGREAFIYCTKLDGKLSLSSSITTIQDNTFKGCYNLKGDLVIPNSVTSIGISAFDNCKGLTNITIGTSVTKIGSKAFYCNAKTHTLLNTENEVALAYDWAGSNRVSYDYVLSTSNDLFGDLDDANILHVIGTGTNLDITLKDVLGSDVDKVTGIVFDTNTIESIGDDWCYAYDEEAGESYTLLPNLSGNLVLPNSVKTIGSRAFTDCSGFTGDLVIPDSVNSLGPAAFSSCSGFNGKLEISENIDSISNLTFMDCSNLTGNLVIPESVTLIGSYAFAGCSGLTGDLVIPNSVTTIYSWAFYDCYGFTGNLVIPDSVTEIWVAAFNGCSGLDGDLVIPDSVTLIAAGTFARCSSISEINIPDSVTTIETNAFAGCDKLQCISIGTGVQDIGNYAFGFGDLIDGKLVSDSYLPTNLITNNTYVMKYDWYGDYRTISNDVFLTMPVNTAEDLFGKYNLRTQELIIFGDGKDLDIPLEDLIRITDKTSITFQTDTVENICDWWAVVTDKYGDPSFSGTRFTGNLILPESLRVIGEFAFAGCSGFTGDITIPESVTNIDGGAFAFCSNLGPTLTIPESVTIIVDSAFLGCNKITSIKIADNGTPITIGGNSFLCCDFDEDSDLVPASVPIKTKLYSTNESVLAYDWASDMRDIELGLKKYTLNTEGTLFGYLDTDTGELTVKGTGTTLDVMLATAMGDDASLVKNIVFATDNLEVVGEGWCDNYSGNLPNLQGTIAFPSTLKTIEAYAFRECSGITGNLTIPSGVTAIGNEAFYDCVGLTGSLSLPDSLSSIGSHAFFKCSGLTGNLKLPSNISSIGSYAFYNCSGFTGNLEIPETITVLNAGVFMGCSGLTGDLTIPTSVTSIASFAFENCSGFNGNLAIPSGVTTIGSEVFYNCSGLKGTLTIPDSVTSIGQYAFFKCSGFTGDLVLPDSVITIGKYAFYNCSGLDGSLTLPANITRISEGAFLGCASLSGDLSIPESVTVIESQAFKDCSGFTGNIEIPSGATTIGDEAFHNCTGFGSTLHIPSAVTSIGDNAFSNCSNISNIKIGTKLTSIGNKAFFANARVHTYVDTTNETALNYDWAGDNRVLCKYILNTSKDLFGYFDESGVLHVVGTGTDLDWQLSDVLGADVNLLKGISFDTNTIETIGDKWCYNRTVDSATATEEDIDAGAPVFENLAGPLVLPTSLKSIGGFAFAYCFGFTGDLVIPSSVTFIDGYAFRSCTGFTGNLVLSEGLKTISERAFSYCSGFTGNLIIPSSVTTIGDSAFKNCSGFTGDLIIPSSITNINYSTFYGCSGLDGDLVIPDSVKVIGTYAFAYCSGFTRDLTIPNSVTTIGSCAFRKCTGFTGDLVIPNSVTSLGNKAFSYCSGFNGILVISDSITNLEESTFAHCSGLTGDLTIPDGVTAIGDEAFFDCSGFSDKLIVPNTVTSLGNKAFSDCDNLTKLYIGNGVTTVGAYCFYVPNLTNTKLFTKSTAVKEHTWSTDNRNVSAMNSFVVGLPQNISLSPTYLNSEDDPVYYASFNMEVSGQFESDSYGKFNGVPSFTISSESGDTRTVTTNISDTTLDSSGTIVVPVVLEAPNPDLSQEFTGTLNIATTLVECVPESIAD